MSKHRPTPPERREAALRYQAERLLRDAAAWGYTVAIIHECYAGRVPHGVPIIHVLPSPNAESAPAGLSRATPAAS